jgi:hypothetical protein
MAGSKSGMAVAEYTTRDYCETARATLAKEYVERYGWNNEKILPRVNTICIEKK